MFGKRCCGTCRFHTRTCNGSAASWTCGNKESEEQDKIKNYNGICPAWESDRVRVSIYSGEGVTNVAIKEYNLDPTHREMLYKLAVIGPDTKVTCGYEHETIAEFEQELIKGKVKYATGDNELFIPTGERDTEICVREVKGELVFNEIKKGA